MPWLEYLLLLTFLASGVFLTLFTLPGIWLMVAAVAVYKWLAPAPHLNWWALGIMLFLAVAAELIETLSASRAAKRSGGSRRAGWGALIGGIIGGIVLTPLIPVPVIGTILGVCLGVFIGALVMEFTKHGEHGKSIKVGYAAAKGRLAGALVKVGIGGVVFLIAAVAAWPR